VPDDRTVVTAAPAADTARWIRRPGGPRATPAAASLLCFHHAGGTAGGFRHWPRALPPSIEVLAVQLPGRAERLREAPFSEMTELVDVLVEHVRTVLDRPYACYGLSMGARVCWTLAHRLRDLSVPGPSALYLAGAAAPGWPEGRADWAVSDDDVVAYLREMGGTPPEVFAQPALLAALLPTLRADLTLVDSSRFTPEAALDVPILAFAGTDDAEGGPERMAGWARQTVGRFALTEIPGGHFFDAAGEQRVLTAIASDLAWTLDLPAAR
jgi:medium-chain acyl-[acyl-carrier-protein] hydrolase